MQPRVTERKKNSRIFPNTDFKLVPLSISKIKPSSNPFIKNKHFEALPNSTVIAFKKLVGKQK